MIDFLASLIQSSKFSDLIADRLDRAGWLVVLFTIEDLVKACNIAHECLRDNTGQFQLADLHLLLSAGCRESGRLTEMVFRDILRHRKDIIHIDICRAHRGHIADQVFNVAKSAFFAFSNAFWITSLWRSVRA